MEYFFSFRIYVWGRNGLYQHSRASDRVRITYAISFRLIQLLALQPICHDSIHSWGILCGRCSEHRSSGKLPMLASLLRHGYDAWLDGCAIVFVLDVP